MSLSGCLRPGQLKKLSRHFETKCEIFQHCGGGRDMDADQTLVMIWTEADEHGHSWKLPSGVRTFAKFAVFFFFCCVCL